MDDPRQQHGNHTWDIIVNYYRCPQCGYILENREKFLKINHHLVKDLVCSRCQQGFTITKKIQSSFGPLLGHDLEWIDN